MPRRQRGFTLMEVLVALMVFAISVVGLVAMESRSIEAQKASAELREAERIAQDAMSDLMARSLLQMLQEDFEGNAVSGFPYEDASSTSVARTVAFRRPPSLEDPLTTTVPGSVAGKYIVHRSVSLVTAGGQVVAGPPFHQDDDLAIITGLELEVTVMWIDDTNPSYPPPTTIGGNPAIAANLTTDMLDPADPDFAPYVGSVRLRTLRVNDIPTLAP